MNPAGHDDEVIRIIRKKVVSIETYEIHVHELDALENGEQVALDLNLAVAFVSLGIGAIFTLLTGTFDSNWARQVTLSFAIQGNVLGAFFLVCWFRKKNKNKTLCTLIRTRQQGSENVKPPAEVPDQLPVATDLAAASPIEETQLGTSGARA